VPLERSCSTNFKKIAIVPALTYFLSLLGEMRKGSHIPVGWGSAGEGRERCAQIAAAGVFFLPGRPLVEPAALFLPRTMKD
jgi:hypothetical protein